MYQSRRKNLGLVTVVIILAVFLMTALGATHSWAGGAKQAIDCSSFTYPPGTKNDAINMEYAQNIDLILVTNDPTWNTSPFAIPSSFAICSANYWGMKTKDFEAIYTEKAATECELQSLRELAWTELSDAQTSKDFRTVINIINETNRKTENALQKGVWGSGIPAVEIANGIICPANELKDRALSMIP